MQEKANEKSGAKEEEIKNVVDSEAIKNVVTQAVIEVVTVTVLAMT